ncbi:MAG TPA: hypothetical protein EYG01_02945 [Flavobacteriales bacterium]|nr:hypothetical protein [Flavobacteriales bacterium]
MKKTIFFCFCLFLFACSSPNIDLELKEIRLINRDGDVEVVDILSDLKSVKDTGNYLEIKYFFYKNNISPLKSGLLQIDNAAFFRMYLNDKLVLDKSSSFFMDTLLSSKRDSFIYKSSLSADYFISSEIIKKSILSGENTLLLKFQNTKFYKLQHNKTKLYLSNSNDDFPSKKPKKSLKKSALPWLSIHTKNGIKDEPKLPAKLSVQDGEAIFKETIQIEIRGNTSQSFKKKSYSFIVINENKTLKKVSLLNLPKHEHWILYGPYADKSLMRNVLAYRLFEKMGYYAPRTKFCELSINGFYQGLYVLCEKIRVDSSRLDLKNGYLIKLDRPKNEFFQSNISNGETSKTVFEIVHPNNSALGFSERIQIQSFVHLFEESLFLSDENSLDIFEIIDMNSFIDFLIINEFCKNIDAYRLSTYFQISEEKKLKMGPIWDFNFSFGLTDYLNGYKSSGFVYSSMEEIPFWWEKLNQNKFFNSALTKRWKQLRISTLSDEVVMEMVEKFDRELEIAQENNFDKWSLLGQKEVWPNYYIGDTHQDEVNYLQRWISERAKWLDKQWKN